MTKPTYQLHSHAEDITMAAPMAGGRVLPRLGACSTCNISSLCVAVNGLSSHELQRLDRLVDTRQNVRRGSLLFQMGEPFTALYVVRAGFFKTTMRLGKERSQVIGFQMAGELLGLDAIDEGRYGCDAVALEDSQVCVVPFERMKTLAQDFPPMLDSLNKAMSREIAGRHGAMLLLGSLRAEERVAAFVLNLARRLQARGFSPTELMLRMTRAEIGSYLGLKLETVSRMFSKFHDDGLLEVSQRHVRVRDEEGLRRLAGSSVF